MLGLGKIAQTHHLPLAASSARATLAAVCDISADLADQLGARHGAALRTTSVADLLAAGLDGVMVCNRDHAPVVTQFLDAGIAVFVEKPLCWSSAQAAQIMQAAQRTGAPVLVGYMKRYDPAVAQARALIGAGELQFIHVLHRAGGRHRMDRLYHIVKPGDLPPRLSGRDQEGVERAIAQELGTSDPLRIGLFFTLLELLSHDFNLVRYLLGGSELGIAFAHCTETPAGRVFQLGLRSGDVAIGVDCFPSFSSARSWDEEVALYAPDRSVKLCFPTPFLREGATTLETRDADARHEVTNLATFTRRSPFSTQFEAFLDVVAGGPYDAGEIGTAGHDISLVRDLVAVL